MTEQSTTTETTVTLGVNDLAVVVNIIDLAVKRGAFNAAEAKAVGETFEKVLAFVKAHTEAQAAASEEEVATDEASSEE